MTARDYKRMAEKQISSLDLQMQQFTDRKDPQFAIIRQRKVAYMARIRVRQEEAGRAGRMQLMDDVMNFVPNTLL